MNIFLVRHGATDWNLQGRCQGASDRELDYVGVRQAGEISVRLSAESIQAVYSSDLRRAHATARLISEPHGLPVFTEEAIRELDHGELEGLTFEQIKQNYGDFLKRWRSEPAEIQVPGGERLTDVAERAWSGLNRIVVRHSSADSIVVVSHNFPISGILCRIAGTHLNSYRSFHVDPCGMTQLRFDGPNEWRITHINDREYVPDPLTIANGSQTSG
ncbi:MAG TPA: histidine phosphatase family protein [Candidatus Binatia bacterium]|jgi:broad specificity phosphatase PhoE